MDYVGEEDTEAMLREMGISGDDDDDDISGDDDDIGEEIGRRRRKRGKLELRKVLGNSIKGRARAFPFLMTPSLAVADDTIGTLSGTADRRALLKALFVQANSVLGVQLHGVAVSDVNINGRNAVIGSGSIPAFMAFGEFGQNGNLWSFGVIEQGGIASVSVVNRAGATVDVTAGFRGLTTD